jgi:cystathionine gamma-synthase
VDIEEICKYRKRTSIDFAVDNTFASLICQQPLFRFIASNALTTKYLKCHSDVTSGILMTSKKDDFGKLK